jgi:transposase
MNPYSYDLRKKIVSALEERDGTQEEVAERFSVSLSFVEKVWRRWRTTGSFSALPHGGGRKPSLQGHAEVIRKEIARQPDATLEELVEYLTSKGAPRVSLATMCLELQRLSLPRKKSRSTTQNARRSA